MKKIAIANIKMNLLSPAERERYLGSFEKEIGTKKFPNVEIVLCPPFIHLEAFKKTAHKKIILGAQDVFSEKQGSFTGEISPAMLKNFSCEYVIVGHSERRRFFSENNHEINLKILAALKEGIVPVICIGENKDQEMSEVVAEQFRECLEGVSRVKIEKTILCYEPVWAISSNNPDHPPTTNEIMSARLLIKKLLAEKYGLRTAERVRIIYGGSVAPNNVEETCIKSGMDGGLVGRESLTPHEFMKIVSLLDGKA
jgi:triosephosphate isomerase